ncbi:unnamed protein product [Symbiodinium sp. CCMP2456]|nr:unnamed protein product [Symbiodinium sp. CCMP2456]
MTRLLLEHRADCNIRGHFRSKERTVLEMAVDKNHQTIVDMILEQLQAPPAPSEDDECRGFPDAEVRLVDIGNLQRDVCRKFACGRTLEDTIQEIVDGDLDPATHPNFVLRLVGGYARAKGCDCKKGSGLVTTGVC